MAQVCVRRRRKSPIDTTVKKAARYAEKKGRVLRELRDGIEIIFYVDKNTLSKSALENLDLIIKTLREKGLPFKKIEVDSIAGYYLRGVKKGRFIPLSTMHMARLLKR